MVQTEIQVLFNYLSICNQWNKISFNILSKDEVEQAEKSIAIIVY